MRFSYSILFLGLWLTGQCWVRGETIYPKPSISVRPSETVELGGTVNIHCKNEDKQISEDIQVEFLLVKVVSSVLNTVRQEVAKHNEVVFPIVNATPSYAGMYQCIYCFQTYDCQDWSHYSDSVNISIRGKVPNKFSSSENVGEMGNNYGNSSTIIWAGVAAGCLILVLLLLLLALVLYRRRKKGSTTHKRTQPLPMKETSLPLKPVAEEEAEDDPDGVSYAVLSHYSLKKQEHAKPDSIPESCVYASVANGIARKS